MNSNAEMLKKSELSCLESLDKMCELLAKAYISPNSPFAKVPASRDVPDYSPEEVVQAKTQKPPAQDQMMMPEDEGQAAVSPAIPETPTETIKDLSEYTPERLQEIVKHASEHIAHALMQGILAEQKAKQGSIVSAPTKL